ncbi:DNA methyltransferase [Anaerostipes sp.]|uniref:DNA methyltransferase n=1 Tax=Anaerostipes sp. TaxID=1872530 RepID=UPI0025C69947|nr:DNA methyltransferase [Anaerostipes sp.]MBS7006965.1 DNA methyltransferase [Anaerostipes sp.]
MKLAIETFVCCFIIAAGMFLNVLYCVNTKAVSNAKQYQSAAVHKMHAADFSEAVVDQCKKEASEDGYVSLDVSREDSESSRSRCRVTLKYKLQIPLFGIEKVCQVRSYANCSAEDGI